MKERIENPTDPGSTRRLGILFSSGFVDDESKSKTMEKKIPAVINFFQPLIKKGS